MILKQFIVTIRASWLPANASMKNVLMPVLYIDLAKCVTKTLKGIDHTFGAN